MKGVYCLNFQKKIFTHLLCFIFDSLDRERMLQVTHTLEAFANFPGIAGCQTKMLLGSTCGAHMLLTDIGKIIIYLFNEIYLFVPKDNFHSFSLMVSIFHFYFSALSHQVLPLSPNCIFVMKQCIFTSRAITFHVYFI